MSKIHIWEDGVTTERDATTDEQAAIDAIETEFNRNGRYTLKHLIFK